LHGALGSSAQFDALIPSLTAHLTCHTLDFTGHGLTPQPQGHRVTTFRIEDFAKQVLGWLDRQQIGTIDVLATAWAAMWRCIWPTHSRSASVEF
jgi:pimeloyl-ACP methyl ester carboxylesterase